MERLRTKLSAIAWLIVPILIAAVGNGRRWWE